MPVGSVYGLVTLCRGGPTSGTSPSVRMGAAKTVCPNRPGPAQDFKFHAII